MIYSLCGTLAEKHSDELVLVCGGVGFRVSVPLPTAAAAPAVGQQCTLYTHMQVKEDGIELFGFSNADMRGIFKMLISVSGVGPKAALSILSVLPAEKIFLAISAGDYKAFTACQGVGPKIAQRLVLELKDKVRSLAGGLSVEEIAAAPAGGSGAQAVGALLALGYSQSEAAQAISRLDGSLPVEELVKQALRHIGGGK